MDRWNLLIAAHAVGATLALLLGGYVVVRRPKGDRLHRRLGRIWVATMYWVALSSFGIKQLTPGHFSWIHALSAWTIVSLTVAIWAARTGRVRTHRQYVVGSYFGLVGAGVAAAAFPVRLVPQTLIHAPVLFFAVLANIALIAVGIVMLSGRDTGRDRMPAWNRSHPASGAPAPATSTGTSSTPVPTA
ncbi:MAG: hypothetical protein QOJ79_3457 [Actinomycetota bacterium]|jgi:uncharacterized membrane protein|nr:hypothetical protein [Actinomycetota bacterium]